MHIVGMGLMGSFLADELASRGVEFTWEDIEHWANAWQASTGAILPCDEEDLSAEAQGYRFWRDAEDPVSWAFLEVVQPFWIQKTPPKGTKQVVLQAGTHASVWKDQRWAATLNVPAYVQAARQRHAARRGPRPEKGLLVMANGALCGATKPIPAWGWSLRCRVQVGAQFSGLHRPQVMFSGDNRSERFYLYPLPNEPGLWLGGSDTVLQKSPQQLPERARQRAKRFEQVAERLAPELFVEALHDTLREGWRPKVRPTVVPMFADKLWQQVGRLIVYRPLYKSGVQLGPMLAKQIAEACS